MNSTSIGPLAILYPGLLNFFVIELKSSLSKKNSLVKLLSLQKVSQETSLNKYIKLEEHSYNDCNIKITSKTTDCSLQWF